MHFLLSYMCQLPHEVAPTIKKSIVSASSLDEAKRKLSVAYLSKYSDGDLYKKYFRVVKHSITNSFHLIIN